MRKLLIALALTLALVLGASTAALAVGNNLGRPQKTINCKNERYPCAGTPRSETMLGTNSHDRISAKGGNDYIFARNGCCETSNGGHGKDHLIGGRGVDYLHGDQGDDDVYGGRGGDYINGGSGNDYITGDKDNDRINANDGQLDGVACGPGRDRVTADPRDRLYNCEDVTRR